MSNIDINMIIRIRKINNELCSKERLNFRKKHEDLAISIIDQNISSLEEEDFREILKLLDKDLFKGARFGKTLKSNTKDILDSGSKILNECVLHLYWNEDLRKGEFFIDNIRGAREPFLSFFLYLKNRDKYKPFTKRLKAGIEKIFQIEEITGSFKEEYETFNKFSKILAEKCKLEDQAVDIVLTEITSQDESF